VVTIPLHHISAESKYELLLALLDDHLNQYEPQSVIRFATRDGRVLGHFTPTSAAKAEWERRMAELPEDVRRMATAPLPN
jgi:hypothetical protein